MKTGTKYDAFLDKQESIYQEFRAIDLTHGLKPSVPERQAGYILALRHSGEVGEIIGEVSRRIQQITPVILYSPSSGGENGNVHTTISCYGVSSDFEVEEETLSRLAKSTRRALNDTNNKGAVNHKDWTANKNTVIAPGYPNTYMFEVTQGIVSAAQEAGLGFKMPKMTHITVARFLDPTQSKEKTMGLKRILEETPSLGASIPVAIDVGHFELTKEGFTFNTYDRINF